MNGFDAVFEWLARAARTTRALWLLSGAAAAAVVLSAGTLAGAVVAAHLHSVPAARAVLAVSALAALGLAVLASLTGFRRSSTPLDAAHHVQDSALREMLRTAVELRSELVVRDPYPYSPSLTLSHAASAGAAAEAHQPAAALGLKRRPREIIAAFACAGALLACALGPASLRSALGRTIAPAGAPASTPAAVPGLWFEISYRAPAYAGRPDRLERRRDGSLKALRGSEARVSVTYVGGIKKAEAVRGDLRVPMQAIPPNGAAATFVLDAPFSYRVEFEGAREKVVTPEYAAEVVPDKPPQAEILGPADLLSGEKEVAEDGTVEMPIAAEDDFGVRSVAIVASVQGTGKERVVHVAEPSGAPTRWGGEHRIELGPLGLAPGDRVTICVEARDNDAVSGSKPGRSRNYHLKVYSSVEHHAAFIEKAARAWESLIAWLAFDLEHPLPSDSPDGRSDAAATALDLLRAARAAAVQAPMATEEVKAAVATALGEIGRAHAEVTAGVRAASRKDAPAGVTAAFSRRLSVEVAALERHVITLQDLLDRERIALIDALSADIDARKKRLGDLIDKYRATKDERLRAEIDAELAALESKLRDLQKLVAQLQHGISDVNVNRTALRDADLSRLAELAREARAEFAKDDPAAMEARLRELGGKMDALSQGMRALGADLGDARYAELVAKVVKMSADLSELAAREKDLLDQTMARRNTLKKREESFVAGRAKAANKRLLEAIETLRREMAKSPDGLEPTEAAQVAGAAASAETLKKLVGQGEFWDAADEARGLVGKLGRLAQGFTSRRMAGPFETQTIPDRTKALRDAEARALSWHRKAGEISRTIDGLFPKPGQLFSKPEAQEMQGMAGTQDGIGARLGRVRESLDSLKNAAPMMPGEIAQGLAEAQDGMGASSRNLRSLNPYGARSDQEGALDRLEKARDALEKMASPKSSPFPFASGSQRGGGDPGGGRELAREHVAIPKPSDYTVPREFRQDILDAMKEKPVRGYEDATKRYYEVLVK
ncbi:MAG: hypothetical protein HY897_03115 [Deltaproteobacteria bacterium]|nr:hypothetical protein [Deltaproteobacteria bacterium]